MIKVYELLKEFGWTNRESEEGSREFARKYDSRAYWEKDETSIDFKEIDKLDVIAFLNRNVDEPTEDAIEMLAEHGITYCDTFNKYHFD